MRNLSEELERARTAALVELIRTLVREEIALALNAVARAADELDAPYETAELDSRAYQAGKQVAATAVGNLKRCWTEGHENQDWFGRSIPECRRCGAPVSDPFETKDENDGTS